MIFSQVYKVTLSKFNRAAKIVPIILLLAGAGLFIWGSDKGFDFTDEGLYLLVYQNPQEFPDSYTSYHRVGSVIFWLVSQNIVALRLLGFFLTSLITFYFGYALIMFLKGRGGRLLGQSSECLFMHLTLQGSVLSAYCWLPPTPNYNSMVGIGMLLSCSGIFTFYSTFGFGKKLFVKLLGIFALSCGILITFLAKGSSAVGITVLSVIFVGLCGIISIYEKISLTLFALASFIVGIICMLLFAPELFVSINFFLGSVVSLARGDGASGIIERHFHEAVNFSLRHLDIYTLPILLSIGVPLIARLPILDKRPKIKGRTIFLIVTSTLLSVIVLAFVRDAYMAGIQGRSKSMYGYTVLFLVLLIMGYGLPGFLKTIAPLNIFSFSIFLAWLALLPFATAAGTTHKIFINSLLHAAPLSAASVLLAASLDQNLRRRFVLPFTCFYLVSLGFSQFFSGFMVSPYRIAPKWTQTIPVEIGYPSTILKIDQASAQCILQTRMALAEAGFQPGDDILALYGLPGLVYAVGGVSPQKPWFFNDHGALGDEENFRALKRVPLSRITSSFIFRTDADSRVISQLKGCGVDFAEKFEKIDESLLPCAIRFVEIWKPK